MFQVIITQLQDSCGQLERQIRQLSIETEELENAISAIASLSGMEELKGSLQRKKEEMRQEEYVLRQMLQVLNKVLLNYVSCENRIVNVCEQNICFIQPRNMGMVNIQKISDLIS